jgi:hypothetical protein
MPEITKRRVTMRSTNVVGHDTKGKPLLQDHEAVDYVRPDHLDAYVADARTKWQSVEVSDEPDAGPGGYHGQTAVPEHLSLPDAGTVYPAEKKG